MGCGNNNDNYYQYMKIQIKVKRLFYPFRFKGVLCHILCQTVIIRGTGVSFNFAADTGCIPLLKNVN